MTRLLHNIQKILPLLLYTLLQYGTTSCTAHDDETITLSTPHVSIYMLCNDDTDVIERQVDFLFQMEDYYSNLFHRNDVDDAKMISVNVKGDVDIDECSAYDNGVQVHIETTGSLQFNNSAELITEQIIHDKVTAESLEFHFALLCDEIIVFETGIGEEAGSGSKSNENKSYRQTIATSVCTASNARITTATIIGIIIGIVIFCCSLLCCISSCCC